MPVWEESIKNYSNNFNFIKHNCSDDECNNYEYQGVPMIYIKNKKTTVTTSVGYKDYPTFEALLQKYI